MKASYILFVAGILFIVGCGSQGQKEQPALTEESKNQTDSTPAVEVTPWGQAAPVIDGPVTVVFDTYGITDGTGYIAVVAFRVKNPNKDVAAVDVPFRVTISTAAGNVLFTSDGTDTLSVAPEQSHLVVFETSNIHVPKTEMVELPGEGALALHLGLGTLIRKTIIDELPYQDRIKASKEYLARFAGEPATASIKIYPGPSMFQPPSSLGDSSKWSVSNARVVKTPRAIAYGLTADVKWNGAKQQHNISIIAAIHEGGDASAPIIAGGKTNWPPSEGLLDLIGSNGKPKPKSPVASGQTIPVHVTINGGLDSFGEPRKPSGPMFIELFVQSRDAVSGSE